MNCQNLALHIDDEVRRRLARHNEAWSRRLALWCKHAQAPWWGEGLVVSPSLRGLYEEWLPIREYLASMGNVARAFLPGNDWLPYPLRKVIHLSLPDLWADLPSWLGGKLLVEENELLPLLCAMAEPRSFGTSAGRYAAQLSLLKEHAWLNCSILDIGCGIGINTLEIAFALRDLAPNVTGLTSEWLEVWMAQNRRIPHDPKREAQFPESNAAFLQGNAEHFNLKTDIITANGIIGGRFLCKNTQYARFLDCCEASGASLIFAANHFHQGRQPALLRFVETAAKRGWTANGTTGNLMLTL